MKHLAIAASLAALASLPLTALAQAAPAAVFVAAAPVSAVSFDAVALHYGELVHASYADTLQTALAMQRAIAAFVKSPSADALAAARKAWLEAREFYGQTEAFRFYGGPIDDGNGPEGRINAWPMDESFVDGIQGKPDTGLINKRKFVINKNNLARQNERGGEENIGFVRGICG